MKKLTEEDIQRPLAKRFALWSGVLDGTKSYKKLEKAEEKAILKAVRQETFEQLRTRCQLRTLPALAIFKRLQRVRVPLSAIDDESGHPNHAEMVYVLGAAKLRGPKRIFEFGTFLGRTTWHFAEMNPSARVWTLDLPREDNPWRFADLVGSYFANTPEGDRIEFIRRDARTFDTTPYRKSMDFIWVDGDHSYKGVKNDTVKAFEMLAPGGAIFWHDFGPDSLELVRYFVGLTRRLPLFHINRTSVLVYLDGVDPLTFKAHSVPFSKETFRRAKRKAVGS